MTIYLAAPWAQKRAAALVKQRLIKAGLTVTSRWTEFKGGDEYEHPEAVMRTEALNNLEDLAAASQMLYLNLEKSEGKATELGIAVACGKQVYVVGGKQNNVFLHLPEIVHLDSVDAFIALVRPA